MAAMVEEKTITEQVLESAASESMSPDFWLVFNALEQFMEDPEDGAVAVCDYIGNAGFTVTPDEPTEEMVEAGCGLMLRRLKERMADDNNAPGMVAGTVEMYKTMTTVAKYLGK